MAFSKNNAMHRWFETGQLIHIYIDMNGIKILSGQLQKLKHKLYISCKYTFVLIQFPFRTNANYCLFQILYFV